MTLLAESNELILNYKLLGYHDCNKFHCSKVKILSCKNIHLLVYVFLHMIKTIINFKEISIADFALLLQIDALNLVQKAC